MSEHELYVRDKNPSMDEIRPDPQHLLSLKLHWGLHRKNETLLFYGMIIPCWALEIAAAAMGPYLRRVYYCLLRPALGGLVPDCFCHDAEI
jgi:hypothetical protein